MPVRLLFVPHYVSGIREQKFNSGRIDVKMPPKGSTKQKDFVMQMLEALAKRMESIRDKVEEIGTKVSDLEAQKQA